MEHIWGGSEREEDLVLVNEIKSKSWIMFAKDDETLLKNRLHYKKVIEELKLPPYCFNASAQAQFMRYAGGATASASYNPCTGEMSASLAISGNLSLAEGKANVQWMLPDSEGFNLSLPSYNKVEKLEWVPVELEKTTANNFEHNEYFLLPSTIKMFNSILIKDKWDIYNRISKGLRVQIVGHTDTTGEDVYNDELSIKRAQVAYELLTYNYMAWYQRFESNQWQDREIKIMLGCVLEIDESVVKSQFDESLSSYYWKKVVKHFQGKALNGLIKTPTFPDLASGCDVKYIQKIDSTHGIIRRHTNDGRVGTKNLSEKETLKLLVQSYMQKSTGKRFLLDSSFYTTKIVGEGESQLAIQTGQGVRSGRNRRVEVHLLEAKQAKDTGGTTVQTIPLGHMRLQIEAYLSGYAGASAILSTELAYTGHKGVLKCIGLKEGQAKNVIKEEAVDSGHTSKKTSSGQSHTFQDKNKVKYNVGTGFKGQAGAFVGAEATTGLKAILEWKCPKPEPEFYVANELSLKNVPQQYCAADEKKAPEVLKMAGFKEGFGELGSAGYALTGSAGIGLKGEFQIGFDETTGKFVIKALAKAVLGVGAGGAFEFSIGVSNVYWFTRFVHAQLNDHNFNYVNFIEGRAFDVLSAWHFELLKNGFNNLAQVPKVALSILNNVKKLMDDWEASEDEYDAGEKLAKQINDENYLVSYISPEVKGRILYLLCTTGYLSRENDKEKAIIKLLQTVTSQVEYREILEHMGPTLPPETDKDIENARVNNALTLRTLEKKIRLGEVTRSDIKKSLSSLGLSEDKRKTMIRHGELSKNYKDMLSSEERLLSILDNDWIFGGNELTEFKELKSKLPEVAPKLEKR